MKLLGLNWMVGGDLEDGGGGEEDEDEGWWYWGKRDFEVGGETLTGRGEGERIKDHVNRKRTMPEMSTIRRNRRRWCGWAVACRKA